jgi:hypothetical protein
MRQRAAAVFIASTACLLRCTIRGDSWCFPCFSVDGTKRAYLLDDGSSEPGSLRNPGGATQVEGDESHRRSRTDEVEKAE